MWDMASNYTSTMIGYHAVPSCVDAYMKGDRDFQHPRACVHTTGIKCPQSGVTPSDAESQIL